MIQNNFRRLNLGSPLALGLVGAWPMNEAGGLRAFDSTGLNTPGTLMQGAVFQKHTKGNCVFLDGTNDYVDLGNASRLDLVDNWSFSFWAKANTLAMPSAGGFSAMFGKEQISDANRAVYVEFVDSSDQVRTIWRTATVFATATHCTLTDLNWHFYASTFTNGTLVVYFDGRIAATATGRVTPPSNATASTEVGRRGAASNSIFNGLMQDCKIWKRVLAPTEVKTLYTYPYILNT